tara:strand:- start:5486 stop:5635 length:150 start_codon:yes stop_codon:yes gene_type:complete
MIITRGLKEILEDFSDKEFSLLVQSDPYFLFDFCYMLSLEIQLSKENKN